MISQEIPWIDSGTKIPHSVTILCYRSEEIFTTETDEWPSEHRANLSVSCASIKRYVSLYIYICIYIYIFLPLEIFSIRKLFFHPLAWNFLFKFYVFISSCLFSFQVFWVDPLGKNGRPGSPEGKWGVGTVMWTHSTALGQHEPVFKKVPLVHLCLSVGTGSVS